MNFAVVGVGSFGIKRATAIKSSTNANLVAISDSNKEKGEKAAEILKVPIKSYDEILKDKNIETVCICTPNKFHVSIILDCLKAEKNVFCEKPMCRNLDEANKIIEATKKSNKVLQIGSNHRYFESVMFAKKLVDQGTIGEVLSFNGRIGNNGERLKNSWFWDKEMSGGGTLLDNGCHLLDLSRYFMGEDFISGVGEISNAYWKNIPVEDTASGVFKTKSGKTSSIFCSWRLFSGYFFFEINGSNGYINVDGRFDTHGGDKIFWSNQEEKKIHTRDFSKIKPNSYLIEIDNFLKNLKKGKPCNPSPSDGLEVMRMINFIYTKN